MTLSQLQEWLPFLETAPEGIRAYLLGAFWTLVFLLIVWAILKIIFNQDFRKLYSFIARAAIFTLRISRRVADGALENINLPEPYPRLTRLFSIISMLNLYAASFILTSFLLVFFFLMVPPPATNFFKQTVVMLFSVLLAYLAWFTFVQAERERIDLFRNNRS